MYQIIVIQSVIIVTLVLVIFYLIRYFNKRTSELFDRLMAKSLPEFEFIHKHREKQKHRVLHTMDDSELAEYEKSKKALALVANSDTTVEGIEPII